MENIFYAQSGGVTAVINATIVSLIRYARQEKINVYIGINGIKGILKGEVINTALLLDDDLQKILYTPGGSFGSCRYKLQEKDFPIIKDFLVKGKFNAFLYHGGNDSQDTTAKIADYLSAEHPDILCLGLPKTIDNDLYGTDNCPGFGSASKFLNYAFRQVCLDVTSMSEDSTKVFIMETMGRHTGWLTASCGLANQQDFPGPQLLLIPELVHEPEVIADYIESTIAKDRFCAIAISEGYQADTEHVDTLDAFGHKQLQHSGAKLAAWIKIVMGVKVHLSIPDYLQRSFTPCLSKTDFDQAQAIGNYAVYCVKHKVGHNTMISIIRLHDDPYLWSLDHTPLSDIANKEKPVPRHFLSKNGFTLSKEGINYFKPLIVGHVQIPDNTESFPAFWSHLIHKKNDYIEDTF